MQPDRFYKRDGLDLIATVPINIAQATFGIEDQREDARRKKGGDPDPAGHAVRQAIPRPRPGNRERRQQGDLIVEVQITVPEKLTEEQERMMREFAEAGGLKY